MGETAIYARRIRQRWEMWSAIRRAGIDSRLYCFADERKFLKHMDWERTNVMFLELGDQKSYVLIKKLRRQYPRLNIIAYSREAQYVTMEKLELSNTHGQEHLHIAKMQVKMNDMVELQPMDIWNL